MSAGPFTEAHRVALLGAIIDRKAEAKQVRMRQAVVFCDGHDDIAEMYDRPLARIKSDEVLLAEVYEFLLNERVAS